ncbi:hypothetical protein DFH09DRAFT_1108769 [Mycena vulgaris]|nr:hypothetical protein DFH09DRAFT_1108769 [Mycena vulgaris]
MRYAGLLGSGSHTASHCKRGKKEFRQAYRRMRGACAHPGAPPWIGRVELCSNGRKGNQAPRVRVQADEHTFDAGSMYPSGSSTARRQGRALQQGEEGASGPARRCREEGAHLAHTGTPPRAGVLICIGGEVCIEERGLQRGAQDGLSSRKEEDKAEDVQHTFDARIPRAASTPPSNLQEIFISRPRRLHQRWRRRRVALGVLCEIAKVEVEGRFTARDHIGVSARGRRLSSLQKHEGHGGVNIVGGRRESGSRRPEVRKNEDGARQGRREGGSAGLGMPEARRGRVTNGSAQERAE